MDKKNKPEEYYITVMNPQTGHEVKLNFYRRKGEGDAALVLRSFKTVARLSQRWKQEAEDAD